MVKAPRFRDLYEQTSMEHFPETQIFIYKKKEPVRVDYFIRKRNEFSYSK